MNIYKKGEVYDVNYNNNIIGSFAKGPDGFFRFYPARPTLLLFIGNGIPEELVDLISKDLKELNKDLKRDARHAYNISVED